MCLSGSLSSTQPLLPGDLLQVEERPEVRLCVPVWERSSRPPLSWWPPSSGWRERDQLRVLAVSECPPALTHLPPSHCHVASWDTYHLPKHANDMFTLPASRLSFITTQTSLYIEHFPWFPSAKRKHSYCLKVWNKLFWASNIFKNSWEIIHRKV